MGILADRLVDKKRSLLLVGLLGRPHSIHVYKDDTKFRLMINIAEGYLFCVRADYATGTLLKIGMFVSQLLEFPSLTEVWTVVQR